MRMFEIDLSLFGGRGGGSGIRPSKKQDSIQRLQEAQSRASQAEKALNYTNSRFARENAENAKKAVEAARREADRQSNQRQSVPQSIATYIQKQVGVDLSKYTTETTRKMGGGIVLDWKSMPKNVKTRVMGAINSPYSKYTVEPWSAWQMLIRKRGKNDPF